MRRTGAEHRLCAHLSGGRRRAPPGQSLRAFADSSFQGGNARSWREYLYYHYYDHPSGHQVARHDGVTDGRYKYIHFYETGGGDGAKAGCDELYDLKSDPAEMRNLAGDKHYAGIEKRMRLALGELREKLHVDEY
nr:sulfatase/phosphatase domain-containing protein [Ereboglobus luteus]